MFFLTLLEHKLQLPPHILKLPLAVAIKGELEALFVDKVIQSSGLCISVYDIENIEGGFIASGEGAPTYAVRFRLIMFRPFVGEILLAKFKSADANGLQLTLGFFDDIHIPSHLFPMPSNYGPDPDNEGYMVWSYDSGEDFCRIDEGDEIMFCVHNVNYPPVPIEQKEDSKPFAPMTITVSSSFKYCHQCCIKQLPDKYN